MQEMKNLQVPAQEICERAHRLPTEYTLQTTESRPETPRSVVLLLHGLDERGLRIFRKLVKYLPTDAHIISPNAPFPLPRVKSDKVDYGYSWYFYDKFRKIYHVDQTLSLGLLKNLLLEVNPDQLPVTVIGFSQGGYLAPLLGFRDQNIKHIIGIGCEFRENFFTQSPSFTLDAVHGLEDHIIPPQMALEQITLLRKKDISVNWHEVAGTKHEINAGVGETIQHLLEQYGKRSL